MDQPSYYRRAWREAASAVGLASSERFVAGLIVQIVAAVAIWLALGKSPLQDDLATRFLVALAPFVAYPALLAWKLVTLPATMEKEHGKQLQALQAEIDRLKNVEPPRHPDGVYQDNVLVGKVVNPRVSIANGLVTFDKVVEAPEFDLNKQFEYRDMLIEITANDGAGVVGFGDRILSREVYSIVGRIIARNRRAMPAA